uniref:Beta,beta-carotene 9',10'-oxygenase n=2 Tax=Caenorhabditis tropicalis TaxID=1561998 RepID=A0A1I7TZ04_9PELO
MQSMLNSLLIRVSQRAKIDVVRPPNYHDHYSLEILVSDTTMEQEGFSRLFYNFNNVIEPKLCSTSGTAPSYLRGTMVRNGPGMFEIGDNKYEHWFDGLGFIQRYHFEDGKMYYSARYLESEAYTKNIEAQRIVAGSFGTSAFPDPCKSIFSRFFSSFIPSDDKHDNANVAFTPVGDGLYACTETPHMYRIDLETLKTLEPANFSKYVVLHTCTAHQLYDDSGDVYNIGSRYGPDSAHVFTVTKNPKYLKSESDSSWEHTTKIGEIKCSEAFYPTYMHSFGMSQNYLIMFESPIRIDIKKFVMRNFISTTYRDCMKWHSDKDVNVFILNKFTGEQLPLKLKMDPFFTFHHANTFEKDGCLVVDYCRMEQTGNFDALLIKNMKSGNFQNFLPYLTRLIIPLAIRDGAQQGENLLKSLKWADGCTATLHEDGVIRLREKRTCDISMEFPRYHWEKINMKEYKYVYGSSVLGTQKSVHLPGIVKADLYNGNHKVWRRENDKQVCGEPIFVPDPNGIEEDDGVLIVPVMTISDGQRPFVLILNAKSVEEIARFTIPEARIPLGFHAFYQGQPQN